MRVLVVRLTLWVWWKRYWVEKGIRSGFCVESMWKSGGNGLVTPRGLWKDAGYCPANVEEASWMIASASARSLASVERARSMRRMLCMTVV